MDFAQLVDLVPVISLMVAVLALSYTLYKDKKATHAMQIEESARGAERSARMEDKLDNVISAVDEIKENQCAFGAKLVEHDRAIIRLEERDKMRRTAAKPPRSKVTLQENIQ